MCADYRERIADADRFIDALGVGEMRVVLLELVEAITYAPSTPEAGARAVKALEAWRDALVERLRDRNVRDYESSIGL